MVQMIDGKAVAQRLKQEIKARVEDLKEKGITPGLATILVGEDPASHVYVKNKNATCQELGMRSLHHHLPASTTEEALLKLVHDLNDDSQVHGILVQLPLPKHIHSEKILEAINPLKDVDGFHPVNVGNLVIGRPGLRPCTPYGVMKLLEETKIPLAGKHAVVVGRSNIVGKPVALMLLAANATVTVCHSQTKNIEQVVRQADIVVAAVGKTHFVRGSWVKPGAVVIDVGINRLPNGKLAGDVHFEEVAPIASWITPVPGGVGPMTIIMLMANTVEAAEMV
ncbi:MAG TPA: bifunctional methylenetetrahydrofolate dehydrogenase/methenyltetrahydrofolate cyclohydrolase FolD [Deltaproteobacteria bacterium]|nr:MAG: bifunctional 5,10-methylene-tetrahydrofolate dehydrogenase/5,10-methylene-tetrahydrofolate cyclohydrolase [Deltaproteobacteria bacterium GWA2_45_12]HBF14006.1 bifunctional methylenetetrahydrofolate dehydrogenase/methenyltetrahydrofolate cyclohydrolase FolD [Deltaproteobacteria bacterium]